MLINNLDMIIRESNINSNFRNQEKMLESNKTSTIEVRVDMNDEVNGGITTKHALTCKKSPN